jgi:hypothetical protein
MKSLKLICATIVLGVIISSNGASGDLQEKLNMSKPVTRRSYPVIFGDQCEALVNTDAQCEWTGFQCVCEISEMEKYKCNSDDYLLYFSDPEDCSRNRGVPHDFPPGRPDKLCCVDN